MLCETPAAVSRLVFCGVGVPPSRAGYKYGARSLVCKAAAAFVMECVGFLKFACFLPEFPIGVTGWLIIEHGHTVRFVDGRFGTVRMCVAGGVDANVFTCFSVGGTGLNGVTVRLICTTGGIGDPRVVLIFRFSLTTSGVSFFPAARAVVRGCCVVWPFLRDPWAFPIPWGLVWEMF